MSGPSILFVVDAGQAVGGGHVMRSLTLANALAGMGADCRFIAPPAVDALLETFAPGMGRNAAATTTPQDLTQAVSGARFDAVVFDHYGLNASDHQAMAKGRPTLIIDDLANRPLSGDLILDSGPARQAGAYDGLVPETARLMLGPQYAPVRPEFAELRADALQRRGGEGVGRVVVSMGLTDVDGITARVLERLRPRVGDLGIDVVLGPGAPGLAALGRLARRDERLAIHVGAPDMAWLVANADFAVGAAGSSAWERCVLGLPSLMIVLADNQREAARALAERGAALAVDAATPDFDAAVDRGITLLLTDPALRARLSAAAADVCDGLGATRVAETFRLLIAARSG